MNGKQIAIMCAGVFGTVLLMPFPHSGGAGTPAATASAAGTPERTAEPARERPEPAQTQPVEDAYITRLAAAIRRGKLSPIEASVLIRAAYCSTPGPNSAQNAADELVANAMSSNVSYAVFGLLTQAKNCASVQPGMSSPSFSVPQPRGYVGTSGTRYRYDLSNPSDRLAYSVDPSAQLQDSISADPRRDMDRTMGQQGGGIQP